MPWDIQKLVERCICCEEEAWQIFVKKFSGLLYYSVMERLKRSGIVFKKCDVEDIVQEVFLEIWEKGRLKEVRKRHRISAWLSIMAQTRALNYMRKKKERLLYAEEFYRIDNIKAGTGSDFNDTMLEKLEKLFAKFDARGRLILKLNIIYGKTHKEIAQLMNIPLNTVSTIIFRKKKELKGKLEDLLVE